MANFKLIALIITFSAAALNALADDTRYNACSSMVDPTPNEALATAEKWLDEGDNAAARHCKALALYKLGKFAESAAELEKTAYYSGVNSETKVTALKQASQSWQNANLVDNAILALGKAANISAEANNNKDAEDLLIEKAKLLKAQNRDLDAIQALDQVLEINPGNDDGRLLRAEVLDKLGKTELAKKDKIKALGITPKQIAKAKPVSKFAPKIAEKKLKTTAPKKSISKKIQKNKTNTRK